MSSHSTPLGGARGDAVGRPAVRGALVALLVLDLSFLVNALDRQVLPVLLPSISREHHLSAGPGGLLATVFTLGLGLAGLASGYLADRFRRRTLILAGVAIFSLATIAQPLAVGYADLLTYRVLSGAGEGLQYAALFAAVGAYFDAQRGRALGSLNVAYGLGAFFSPMIGSLLAQTTGSWHTPFFVFGALGAVVLVLVALLVPRWFSEVAGPATDALSEPVERVDSFLNRNLLACAVLCAVIGFCGYGYLGQYPTYLATALRLSPGQTGVAAGAFGLGGLISLASGHLIDRRNPRPALVTAILTVMLVGWLMFNVPFGVAEQTALSVLMGAASSGFMLVMTYTLIQRSAPRAAIGRASGLFTLALYVPATISGYVFAELRVAIGWGGAASVQLVLVPIAALIAALVLDQRVLVPTGRAHR